MKKFRIWAESISDVYLDVEAENKEKAYEMAEAADGGDFIDSGSSDWQMGQCIELPENKDLPIHDNVYDEPVNCPKCGLRTDFEQDESEGWDDKPYVEQIHSCTCGYKFKILLGDEDLED